MSFERGTRIGPYEVIELLGAGGMSEVYRARDPRLGRDVALKVLSGEKVLESGMLERFEQEARAASALNHSSIVSIYDIGAFEKHPFIAMELVEGQSVRELLQQGPLPVSRALEIASKIAFGLARAHEAGIVHRDLKPENVMVGREGTVKVLDFGLAKLTETGPGSSPMQNRLTTVGMIVGTPAYMSPEQAQGQKVDYRSDQFSLGLVLYEMLTGVPAFSGASPVQLMTAIIQEDPAPIATLAPRVPAPVRWVVERCLSKDPENRNTSTRDLARELSTLGSRLSEARDSASLPASSAPRLTRRNGRLFAGALACVLLGAAAGRLVLPRVMDLRVPSLLPLTHGGSDTSPAVSRDGKLVAFTSARDGTPRIWLKVLPGGAEAPLTAGPDELPRFSPDGTQVLFVRQAGAQSAVYRVPVLGGEPRKMLDGASSADWSPDGKLVAFARWDDTGSQRDSRIGLVDADGTNERILARVPARSVLHPRWSPDGTRVAFLASALNDVSGSISILDVGTQQVRNLVAPTSGAHFSSAAWLPDGDSLVYARSESTTPFVLNTNSGARILVQALSGGTAKTILVTPNWGALLDIAGPGRLVLEARTSRGTLLDLPLEAPPVPGRGAEGAKWLTRGSSSDRQPTFSLSGKEVLFSSNRTGDWDLWLVSRDDRSVRNLTDNRSDDWDPAYVGNGDRIVWSSNRTGHFEIWTAAADGSRARRLTNDGVDAENPTATPDGRFILYNSSNPDKPGIWKIREDGTGAQRLVAGRTFLPEVSPDGSYVLYVSNVGNELPPIRVARVSDGSVVPFEIVPGGETTGGLRATGRARWMPDGRAIVFSGEAAGGRPAVLVQDFKPGTDTSATRRALLATHTDARIETFAISRDGRRLVIGTSDRMSTLNLAEGLPGIDRPRR